MNVAAEVDGWDAMIALASAGHGVALINDYCQTSKQMFRTPYVGMLKVPYELVWLKSQNASIKRVAELLKNVLLRAKGA